MWIVAKINSKEISIFKKNLIEKTGKKIEFYYPKILFKKFSGNKFSEKEKPVIEEYLFCYHPNFLIKNFLENFKYIKGLKYFLPNSIIDQKNIINFINHCKKNENEKGFLSPSFFKSILKDKGQFLSGPFKNLIFNIIEKKEKILRIQIGNINTTITSNNYLYKPV